MRPAVRGVNSLRERGCVRGSSSYKRSAITNARRAGLTWTSSGRAGRRDPKPTMPHLRWWCHPDAPKADVTIRGALRFTGVEEFRRLRRIAAAWHCSTASRAASWPSRPSPSMDALAAERHLRLGKDRIRSRPRFGVPDTRIAGLGNGSVYVRRHRRHIVSITDPRDGKPGGDALCLEPPRQGARPQRSSPSRRLFPWTARSAPPEGVSKS